MSITQKLERKFKTKFPIVYARIRNIGISKMQDEKTDIFNKIYESNYWKDNKSVSGNGSNFKNTEHIINSLPDIFRRFNIKSVIDAACGDMLWMSKVDFDLIDSFIGADIVKAITEVNTARYGSQKFKFITANLAENIPPKADMIICRDMMVHNSYKNLKNILNNFKKSGSKYLLATNFHNIDKNIDITTGNWRPLNMNRRPFNFPEPIFSLDEQSIDPTAVKLGKHLDLWELKSLEF